MDIPVCCVYGDTRADVEVAYQLLAEVESPPQRVVWRLTAAFEDEGPKFDECFAPFNHEIREAYEEAGKGGHDHRLELPAKDTDADDEDDADADD